MNGAESLVRTLLAGGVDVCFANPGTSEMHFVVALDRVDGMRCVLGLHETVITGAADGYARMTDKPAATLLHLGPGLANGLSNIHNAARASTPMVNIIGDHATFHRRYDAPLASDIEGAARPFCDWIRTSPNARSVAADGAAAIVAANTPPGQIAALILPADTAWEESDGPVSVSKAPARRSVSREAIRNAARVLQSGEPVILLLTGMAMRAQGLELAGRITAKTGARLLGQTFNSRIERGVGRVPIDIIPYAIDQSLKVLDGARHIILVGAKEPIAFFGYPNKPSKLAPTGCQMHVLSYPEEDGVGALQSLAEEIGASSYPAEKVSASPTMPAKGKITPDALGQSLCALLPANAIVVDESSTVGRGFYRQMQSALPHDWLKNMGGSIGFGIPAAVGAAIACPDRKVLCLEGDGSAMYSMHGLWTQARENLNVTTVVFANRTYEILLKELQNVEAENPGRKALDMLQIGRPDIGWVQLANGLGVEGRRVSDMDEFNAAMGFALKHNGPFLIEVVV